MYDHLSENIFFAAINLFTCVYLLSNTASNTLNTTDCFKTEQKMYLYPYITMTTSDTTCTSINVIYVSDCTVYHC